MDFSTVDVRYESDGATYQDLIDAAHEKGIKIVQDIVVNHSGNFGEATLAPMFTKEYDSIQDLASVDCMKVIEGSDFDKTFPNYNDLEPKYQYAARLNIMKDTKELDSGNHDTENYYHDGRHDGYGICPRRPGNRTGGRAACAAGNDGGI